MYEVYQLRENASVTLSLLSPSTDRKVKCYNKYFFNGHTFYIEEYKQGRQTYNNEVYVKVLTCNEFQVDYYKMLKEINELQYHSK